MGGIRDSNVKAGRESAACLFCVRGMSFRSEFCNVSGPDYDVTRIPRVRGYYYGSSGVNGHLVTGGDQLAADIGLAVDLDAARCHCRVEKRHRRFAAGAFLSPYFGEPHRAFSE